MELTSLSTVHSRAAFFFFLRGRVRRKAWWFAYLKENYSLTQISNTVLELASSLLYWGH